MRKPGIYLSPSKQPNNMFAVGNTNEEKEMVAVAKIIRDLLEKEYICDVHLATLSLDIGSSGRPKEAKDKNCNIYLAIHSNAGGYGKARGAVALYHPSSNESKNLGKDIAEELNRICPYKSNRSETLINGMSAFKGKGYGEIRVPYEMGMTPVLMETNFHDHKEIAKWIIDHKVEIARAYVDGIVKCLGLRLKEKVSEGMEKKAEEVRKEIKEIKKSLSVREASEEGEKFYRVQVGAFKKKENAEILVARLFNEGFEGFIKYS